MRISRSTLVGTAVAVALFGGNAFAQQTTAAQSNSSKSDADSAATLQEIVVTGIRYSVKKSLATKRASTDMTEVATAEDIGKMPAKNVADVLQTLPGIDTQSAAYGEGGFGENDRVSIRGTPASLTLTTIDGHDVANADWFIEDQYANVGRSVSYDLLPSEIVGSTVVNFGENASLVEGGVAGSVDIQTRHALDAPRGLSGFVTGGAAYSTEASKGDPQGDAEIAWNNGTFGVSLLGFYEKRDLRRDGQEFLGFSQVGKSVASAWQAADPSLPNLTGDTYPTLIGESLFTQTFERKGGFLDVQARPSDALSFDLTGFDSDLNATNINRNMMLYGSQMFGNAANPPSSVTVNSSGYITAASFPAFANPVLSNAGTDSAVYDQIFRPDASAKIWFINLDTTFKPTDGVTILGQVGTTQGKGDSPGQTLQEAEAGTGGSYQFQGDGNITPVSITMLNGAGATVPLATNTPNGWFADYYNDDYVTSVDKENYAKLDATFKVDSGVFEFLKAGVRFEHHQRDTIFDAGGPACPQANNAYPNCAPAYDGEEYPSNYQSGIPGGGAWANNIFTYSMAEAEAFVNQPGYLQNPFSPKRYYWLDSFSIQENELSSYVQADMGGDRWSGNIGLRLVNSQENVLHNVTGTEFNYSLFGGFNREIDDHRYFNALPSANFKFDLTHDLVLRLSAAETMALPDYSAVGSGVGLNDTNLTASGGNPDLKPIKGGVFSTDLEYYFGPESMVEAGLFTMDLSSYVDYTNITGRYVNNNLTGNGPAVYSTFTVTTENNEPATINGAFASWTQALPLGFGVNANATFADGTTQNGDPVMGDSRFTGNLGAYWQYGPISSNLTYSYRSHYYVATQETVQEWEDNWHNLNAQVSYAFWHSLNLTFTAENLTNTELRYYTNGNTGIPFAMYNNGRTFYLTGTYKF
ncbi:MAG TPA: TonB-dependent receptor [Steroidobacteraceae bacterium]|nr:TonB-dependent receptor [Steroidobacteraceae bacterium]